MSKLAEELQKKVLDCVDHESWSTVNGLIEQVLAAHGVTDDLVEQHKIANGLLLGMANLSEKMGVPVTKGTLFDYIAAERKAGRWPEA